MRRKVMLCAAALASVGTSSCIVPGAGAAAARGPGLQTPTDVLARALSCPTPLSNQNEPVLLVHGTAETGQSWSWNYVKALPSLGHSVCTVTLPDFGREDIQILTEYVVYAIRTMAERSHRRVDAIGFSQGPMEIRWAIKWWPDIQTRIDDFVMLASPNHGSALYKVFCARTCIRPFWQMRPDSKFLAALNAGDETPGDLSYTSAYSLTDNGVQPAFPSPGTAGLAGAHNIAVQDVCPGRPVEHFGMFYDAAIFAIVTDALNHEGPADVRRIDQAVCTQATMPSTNPIETAAKDVQLFLDFITRIQEHQTDKEPPLAPYASSRSASSRSHTSRSQVRAPRRFAGLTGRARAARTRPTALAPSARQAGRTRAHAISGRRRNVVGEHDVGRFGGRQAGVEGPDAPIATAPPTS